MCGAGDPGSVCSDDGACEAAGGVAGKAPGGGGERRGGGFGEVARAVEGAEGGLEEYAHHGECGIGFVGKIWAD